MKRSILKPIISGVLIGAALFFVPFFVFRVAVFFLIAGLFVRLFVGRRFGRGFGGRGMHPAFAERMDKIRNMTEEEYTQFRQKMQDGCGRRAYHEEAKS